MQAPLWATRIVGWRWTPAFALVAGSLAFVGVVVAIVPDDFGAAVAGTKGLSRTPRSRLGTNAASTLETSSSSSDHDAVSNTRDQDRRAGIGSDGPGNVVQSIFHSAPKVELPVEPVDPTPQPPPAAPPPPPPTATVFTLDTPAPTPPAPEPPSEPQGITGQ